MTNCELCRYQADDETCGAFECNGLECPELPCEVDEKGCIMTEKEQKIKILTRMVENGYHLGDHTIEDFVDMMSLEDWKRSEEKFMSWKSKQ